MSDYSDVGRDGLLARIKELEGQMLDEYLKGRQEGYVRGFLCAAQTSADALADATAWAREEAARGQLKEAHDTSKEHVNHAQEP